MVQNSKLKYTFDGFFLLYRYYCIKKVLNIGIHVIQSFFAIFK